MFWTIVQPFKVTCLLIAISVLLATACAPAFKWRRSRTFLWGSLIGLLLFVPSCEVVMNVIDQSRFGEFVYPDFESVDKERVKRWLPPSATDITVDSRSIGHKARFRVAPDDLVAWFNRYRDKFGYTELGHNEAQAPFKLGTPISGNDGKEYFDIHFEELGWSCPPEFVELHCTVAEDGAGFSILYSQSQETAYLWSGYW